MNRQNRKNTKQSAVTTPDEHFEAIGELLTQLRTHLTNSAGEKGTYADYLRLLDFWSKTNAVQPTEMTVQWIDNPNHLTGPPA
jgi:hypothetical protein